MRFSLGKALRHRGSYPLLVHLCPPTSYASISVISPFVVQITRMDEILVGYWVAGQVRTLMSRVLYNSKLSMGNIVLRRVLMVSYEMFSIGHLKNTSIIALLGSDRSRVGALGDSLLQLW